MNYMDTIDNRPLVAIHCLVYNHEPYLRDCLEGFVMQQTNFPFVAIVHDDASTDNSAAIIREYKEKYPHIFKPIYETENQYSKRDGSLERIMNESIDATGAKYVAMCEGDDFWIDSLKLQKQVNILEEDVTLMAVCSDTSIVDNNNQILNSKRGGVVKNDLAGRYTLRDFFNHNHQYPTASVMYRTTHKNEIREKFARTCNAFLGDWTLWICLHIYGDFYFINEPMVAYRINPTSVTHTYNRVGRAKANRDICLAVADILPEEYADISADLRNVEWVWISLLFAYKAEKNYIKTLGCLLMAIIKCPRALLNTYKKSKTKRD